VSGDKASLTSIPVLSASALSALVLVLGGFALDDTSVVADMIEVSPSMFDAPAAAEDMVEEALGSAAAEVDAAVFRGILDA
jgi:hypothetical protein